MNFKYLRQPPKNHSIINVMISEPNHKIETLKGKLITMYKPGWNQHSVFPEWN
jgi:hypothetical protein